MIEELKNWLKEAKQILLNLPEDFENDNISGLQKQFKSINSSMDSGTQKSNLSKKKGKEKAKESLEEISSFSDLNSKNSCDQITCDKAFFQKLKEELDLPCSSRKRFIDEDTADLLGISWNRYSSDSSSTDSDSDVSSSNMDLSSTNNDPRVVEEIRIIDLPSSSCKSDTDEDVISRIVLFRIHCQKQ